MAGAAFAAPVTMAAIPNEIAAMKKQPKPARPWWRRVFRFCFWLLVVLLIPVVCFVVFNRFDEAPSALAQRFENFPSRQMADADNGWLAMAGLGAPEGTDPLVWGRRKVDAFNSRLQARLRHAEAIAESSVQEDAVSFRKAPTVPVDQVHCPMREKDCLQWALQNASQLDWMRENNALLLQRFGTAMQAQDWNALYGQAADMPMLAWNVPALQMDLLALDLAHAASKGNDADVAAALGKLAGTLEFWQRVRSQPQDMMSILISGKLIERGYWIINAWLDQASAEQISANAPLLDRLLAKPASKVNWDRMVADQYTGFRNTMDETIPSFGVTLWQCFNGSTRDGCLGALSLWSSYAPQATMNLQAVWCDQLQRLQQASPADLPAAEAEASRVTSALFPQFDDLGTLLSQLSYNFAGRVLVGVSIPAFDGGKREHDREALRRMMVIKRRAFEAGVDALAMPPFLQTLDEALSNPLTGQPFSWDAQKQGLSFEPLAEQDWKKRPAEIRFKH